MRVRATPDEPFDPRITLLVDGAQSTGRQTQRANHVQAARRIDRIADGRAARDGVVRGLGTHRLTRRLRAITSP